MWQDRIREIGTNIGRGIENTGSFVNQAVHDERGHLRWKGAAIGFGLGFALLAVNIPLATGVVLGLEHILALPSHDPAKLASDYAQWLLLLSAKAGVTTSALWLAMTYAFRYDSTPTNFGQRLLRV